MTALYHIASVALFVLEVAIKFVRGTVRIFSKRRLA